LEGLENIRGFFHTHQKALIAVVLFIATLAVYYPALDSLMVADDFFIVNRWGFDDAFNSLHNTVGFGRNEYRPVIAFSYALSKSIWQGAPRGYHLDSILLHALNGILLYSWLLLLTGSTAIPGMAAALFVLHPINAERVIWITARDSLFSTGFSLLALICYTPARPADSTSSGKVLIGFSSFFFILSLLSYEGATVVPAIMAAQELFIFAQPGQRFVSRLRQAFRKTLWHLIILFAYLAWWALLFRGQIGGYSLSYASGSLFHNYYSYLYHLFHGNSRIAGVLYFLLLLAAFFLPRERRPTSAFSLVFILVSFTPFVIIKGFADRFAYAGAAGYAALIAILIYAYAQLKRPDKKESIWSAGRFAALLFFAILASYYTVALHSRISDWKAAGQVADRIPRQIKSLHPDLPDGTRLVLARISQMLGHSYVFPQGLEPTIERWYPGRRIQIIYGSGEMGEIMARAGLPDSKILYFNYLPDRQCLAEIIEK
jgi:hypothetical protein